ncbi:MAG: hypothetical protein MJA32_01830, partial [Proteobacteria bacterium]|nr:hypothetical protein [Pseudomonadota bacterium]
ELNALTQVKLIKTLEEFVFKHPPVQQHLEILHSIAQNQEIELVYLPVYGNQVWVQYPNLLRVDYPIPDLDKSNVEEIVAFFSTDTIPIRIVSISNDVRNAIDTTLEQVVEDGNSNHVNLYISQRAYARSDSGPSVQAAVLVDGVEVGGWKSGELTEKISTVGSDIPIEWPEVLNNAGYTKLSKKSLGRLDFLPGIMDRWDSVRTETVVNARTILARTVEERSASKLEFLGIKIPSALITSGIPIALCVVMIQFFLHLRHLSHLTKGMEELRSHSWIPLMRGKLPLAVSAAVIVVLPLFVICALIFESSGYDATSMTYLFGAVFIPISLLSFHQLIDLRSMLHGK